MHDRTLDRDVNRDIAGRTGRLHRATKHTLQRSDPPARTVILGLMGQCDSGVTLCYRSGRMAMRLTVDAKIAGGYSTWSRGPDQSTMQHWVSLHSSVDLWLRSPAPTVGGLRVPFP